MNSESAKLKITKKNRIDKIIFLENNTHGLYAIKANNRFVCMRMNGKVAIDSQWELHTNSIQKSYIKEFLGGMYLHEIRKEILSGSIYLINLN